MKTSKPSQRGAAAVEFSILLGLLLLFIFGIIFFGFVFLQSHYIANAAREGARVAAKSANDGKRQLAAETAVQDYLGTLVFYRGKSCCDSGDYIEVTVQPDGTIPGTSIPGVTVTVSAAIISGFGGGPGPIPPPQPLVIPLTNVSISNRITQSATFALE